MKLTDKKAKQKSACITVALTGNPNVGKSTLFNSLTGLHQHTGNWAGKTVGTAEGTYKKGDGEFKIVDLPGTYSLTPRSAEETVTRDYIAFSRPDAVLAVCDAGCLERNLILLLQILEMTPKTALCINLIDEADRRGIKVNTRKLSDKLRIPVVSVSALHQKGMELVPETVRKASVSRKTFYVRYSRPIEDALERLLPFVKEADFIDLSPRWVCLKAMEGDSELTQKLLSRGIITTELLRKAKEEREMLEGQGSDGTVFERWVAQALVRSAEELAASCTEKTDPSYDRKDRQADKILTGKFTGTVIMLALLALLFWITIVGANKISDLLLHLADILSLHLHSLADAVSLPLWLKGLLLDGVYRLLSWVVCVMLPPMAIFFPLFTLLEDIGYLPRIAFNTDGAFRCCGACGKQALTTCMGFGCNAVGVTGCRIIDSPRERMIAMLTNSFIPCNGKYAALVALLSIFITPHGGSFLTAAALTCVIMLGIILSLLTSKLLSVTLLRGKPSSFTLELPPFRRPRICRTLLRSVLDRTLAVLGRAALAAAPAGALIWLLCNISIGDGSIYSFLTHILDPAGAFLGLDGVILLAFILGITANETVLPLIVTGYMSLSTVTGYQSLSQLQTILVSNGWTVATALCAIIFMLAHSPCATTLLTVKKETGSVKTAFLAFFLPTAAGVLLCAAVNGVFELFV